MAERVIVEDLIATIMPKDAGAVAAPPIPWRFHGEEWVVTQAEAMPDRYDPCGELVEVELRFRLWRLRRAISEEE